MEHQELNTVAQDAGLKASGKKERVKISQERLMEVLDYSPDTGIFIRKLRTSTRVKVGDVVGCLDANGYLRIGIDGKQFWAHRLAWIYVHGDNIGDAKIEHINKDFTDNRICNLRLSTEISSEKICSKCKVKLPATSEYFYTDKTMKLGFSSHCKKCSGNKGKRNLHVGDGFRVCSKCGEKLPETSDYFGVNKTSIGGLRLDCKSCIAKRRKEHYENNKGDFKDRAKYYYDKNMDYHLERARLWRSENKGVVRYHQRKYQYLKLRAVPAWWKDEKELIAKVYEMAGVLGMHVDHIVPINSKIVCGLHCWHNLQLLTPSENRSKSNVYWPDMP